MSLRAVQTLQRLHALQLRVLSSVEIRTFRLCRWTPVRHLATRAEQSINPQYETDEALKLVKAFALASFDETVDISMQLGVDPRKPNQNVRSVAQLPHAFKETRVAVFARGAKAEEARAAGAHIVGEQDLAAQIQAGNINFERCIATPDMMGIVGKVARILGPRGLMPNPKLGTVTMDVKQAIQAAKGGQVAFRTDKNGMVRAPIGKCSFTDKALSENLRVFVQAVQAAKPQGAKGTYVKRVVLSSTRGPGLPLDLKSAPFVASR